MRRFFYDSDVAGQPLTVGNTQALTDTIFHHWCRVLRANVGEQAVFFDGQGGEYEVTLTDINKKTASATVERFNPINRDLPYQVTIGLVISRGERMDYAIQKMTEMGVYRIQLLTSQHGEVRLKADQAAKKLSHWQQIAIAACEQCGLNRVPTIMAPIALEDWCLQADPTAVNFEAQKGCQPSSALPATVPANLLKLVLAVPSADNPDALATIQSVFTHHSLARFALLIGPEGGLSAQEMAQALGQGFLPWQIGERVLRTETAPVVALSALQTVYALSSPAVLSGDHYGH